MRENRAFNFHLCITQQNMWIKRKYQNNEIMFCFKKKLFLSNHKTALSFTSRFEISPQTIADTQHERQKHLPAFTSLPSSFLLADNTPLPPHLLHLLELRLDHFQQPVMLLWSHPPYITPHYLKEVRHGLFSMLPFLHLLCTAEAVINSSANVFAQNQLVVVSTNADHCTYQ